VASLSDSTGEFGDTLTILPEQGADGDWAIAIEQVSVQPRAWPPATITFEHFDPINSWGARIVSWSDSTDPRTAPRPFASLFRGDSLGTTRLPRLDMEWYRPAMAGIPQERWGLEATTVVNLRSEENTLRAISDDGIRVWVDGVLVVDHWAPHESAVDEVPIAPGPHELRVQYYQVDGWAELRVEIVRRGAHD
jgi:hypothetical protein